MRNCMTFFHVYPDGLGCQIGQHREITARLSNLPRNIERIMGVAAALAIAMSLPRTESATIPSIPAPTPGTRRGETNRTVFFEKNHTHYQASYQPLLEIGCTVSDYIEAIIKECGVNQTQNTTGIRFNHTNLFDEPGYDASIFVGENEWVNLTTLRCLIEQLAKIIDQDTNCNILTFKLMAMLAIGVVLIGALLCYCVKSNAAAPVVAAPVGGVAPLAPPILQVESENEADSRASSPETHALMSSSHEEPCTYFTINFA